MLSRIDTTRRKKVIVRHIKHEANTGGTGGGNAALLDLTTPSKFFVYLL